MSNKQAILLGRTGLSVESKKITKVLSFFGVSCGALTIAEVLSSNAANWENSSECKLMGSVDTFLSLIEALERDPSCMQFWQEQVMRKKQAILLGRKHALWCL